MHVLLLTPVIEEIELQIPPPAHELPLSLLFRKREASPSLGYG